MATSGSRHQVVANRAWDAHFQEHAWHDRGGAPGRHAKADAGGQRPRRR